MEREVYPIEPTERSCVSMSRPSYLERPFNKVVSSVRFQSVRT